jgi:DNA gyrase/topoisomerase IV subunit A
MKSFYLVSKDINEIEQLMETSLEETGEISEEIQQRLDMSILNFEEVVDDLLTFHRATENSLAGLELEKSRLDKAIAHRKKVIECLKKYLVEAIEKFGDNRKLIVGNFILGLRKSESVNIINEKEIPDEYLSISMTSKPNKTKIKEAIKSGIGIAGTELISKNNLTIK